MDTYLFEYRHNGKEYVLHIQAESPEDAAQRIQSVALYGSFMGTLVEEISVPRKLNGLASWLARLVARPSTGT